MSKKKDNKKEDNEMAELSNVPPPKGGKKGNKGKN